MAGMRNAMGSLAQIIIVSTVVIFAALASLYAAYHFTDSCGAAKFLNHLSLVNKAGVNCDCDPHPSASCFP
jgi:hypothetical protein